MKTFLNWAIALSAVAFLALLFFGFGLPWSYMYTLILLLFTGATFFGLVCMRIGFAFSEMHSVLSPEDRAEVNKYAKRIAEVAANRLKEGKHRRTGEDIKRVIRRD